MSNRIVAIWSASLAEAMDFINSEGLHNCFIQLIEDKEMKFKYWMIFKINETVLASVILKHPRLTMKL